jgi:hypothetical protein
VWTDRSKSDVERALSVLGIKDSRTTFIPSRRQSLLTCGFVPIAGLDLHDNEVALPQKLAGPPGKGWFLYYFLATAYSAVSIRLFQILKRNKEEQHSMEGVMLVQTSTRGSNEACEDS